MNWLRHSFGAKLLAALVGTVGLLLVITLVTVRIQTDRQIRLVENRSVERAAQLFEELAELQSRQADQLARPFTEGRRTQVMLAEAIGSRDIDFLSGEASYELLRSGLTDPEEGRSSLVVLTDDEGSPVMSLMDGRRLEGDPADVAPLARALLESEALTRSAYRVVDGLLYNLQSRFLELSRRPIGTITFGFPVLSEDVENIAGIGEYEACLFVDGGLTAQ